MIGLFGMEKLWLCGQEEATDDVELGAYSETLHPVAKLMLKRRNITTSQDIASFLNPSWENDIHDPFLFKNMHLAVARIFQALENREHIIIHGDYDADGVTGSSVIASTLGMLAEKFSVSAQDVAQSEISGVKQSRTADNLDSKFLTVIPKNNKTIALDVYIPHREKEGYGLHIESVDLIHKRGANLLITVDCGIANVEEIAKARNLGMDVVVVDHHQFSEQLPDAILIHPKLPDEIYPFKDLAAVGVAWKLACAIIVEAEKRSLEVPAGWSKWLLDLVSIATVTDIVPMRGENRVLEKFGLIVLNKSRRPGIKALIQASSWTRGDLDSEGIGFVIGPRINAAGRMEHAYLAVDLMLEKSSEQAARKAAILENVNRSRQKATEIMMKEAEHMVHDHGEQSIVFAWSETWSPSLVGLAAGRYTDKFGKPAIFVGKHGDQWIGSGRSIPGYDITQAVKQAGENLLTRCGGHAQACGFSLDADYKVRIFAQAMREHALANLELEKLKPFISIESRLGLGDINWKLVETLDKFEPFGESNPAPIFLSTNLTVFDRQLLGANKNHIRCLAGDSAGHRQKFIGFYRADLADILTPGAVVDLVYKISQTEWNGKKEIQCKLVDARKSES